MLGVVVGYPADVQASHLVLQCVLQSFLRIFCRLDNLKFWKSGSIQDPGYSVLCRKSLYHPLHFFAVDGGACQDQIQLRISMRSTLSGYDNMIEVEVRIVGK